MSSLSNKLEPLCFTVTPFVNDINIIHCYANTVNPLLRYELSDPVEFMVRFEHTHCTENTCINTHGHHFL